MNGFNICKLSSLMVLAMLAGQTARAQSNSLFLSTGQAQQAAPTPRPEAWPTASVPIGYGIGGEPNKGLAATSLFAVELPPPRVFKVHDLVTIVIREQKKYKHDAELDTDKEFSIKAKLEQWFRIHDHKWKQQTFPDGKPEIDFKYKHELGNGGGTAREDELITRITVEITDIKPNGTLVLQGRKFIATDEEEQMLTLTGTCRAEDVGPSNTILSTQIHDMVIDTQHKGAVRDASRRGWIPRLLDAVKPF